MDIVPVVLVELAQKVFDRSILEVVGALLAIVGAPAAVIRYLLALERARSLERAKLVTEITKWFNEHKNAYREIFDGVAYKTLSYDPRVDAREKSEKEMNLTTALDLLNTIAYNVHHRVIPARDVRDTTFGYWFDVFLSSEAVQNCLAHIVEHDRNEGRSGFRAFYYLRKYGPRIVGSKRLWRVLREKRLLIGQRAREVSPDSPVGIGRAVGHVPERVVEVDDSRAG